MQTIIFFQGDDYFSRADTVHWMSEYKNEKSVSIKEMKKVLNKYEAKRGKSEKTSLSINRTGTVDLHKSWKCEKMNKDKVLSPVDQRKAVADKTKRQKDKEQQ